MPNYCENDLIISGADGVPESIVSKEIVRFEEHSKGQVELFDFNNFVPYPKKYDIKDNKAREYQERTGQIYPHKDGYNSGGYEWCIKFWGTKWNAISVELDKDENELFYKFLTAWSPPIPIIVKMSKMFRNLRFELNSYECGAGFQSTLVCCNGKVVSYKNGDYSGNRGG